METEPNSDERIAAFVDRLCESSRGLVIAVNMLDSCEHGANLSEVALLREFLADCALSDDPSQSAEHCLKVIADVSAGASPARRSYLRRLRQQIAETTDLVTNVVKAETFHRFILSESAKMTNGLRGVLPLTPAPYDDDLAEYEEIFTSLVARGDWYRSDATLGRPQSASSNCWLSTDRFGADDDAPAYNGDPATQARDELGLVDYERGSCLIQFKIAEGALAVLAEVEVARPVFSDLGNSRFRVDQRSERAQRYAQAGWGATVHLGKLRGRRHTDMTGAPERVASPVPLAKVAGVTARFLGRVTSRAYETSDRDPEIEFRDWVLGSRTHDQVRAAVLQSIFGPS